MKVGGEPSIVTRLRTAFPRGHSSNVAAGVLSVSVSLSKVDSRDDDGWVALSAQPPGVINCVCVHSVVCRP